MPDRPRFTVWRMMGIVAISALFLCVIRGLREPSGELGASIVGACVVIMAVKIARDTLAREKAAGWASSRSQRLRIVLSSTLLALLTILIGNLAFFLIAIFLNRPAGYYRHFHPFLSVEFFAGILSAVGVTVWVRRKLLTPWLGPGPPAQFGPDFDVREIDVAPQIHLTDRPAQTSDSP